MSEIRQHAHQLIELMPEEQIAGVVKFLGTIVALAIDDEPETDEELKVVQEANDWLLRNDGKLIDSINAVWADTCT